MTLDFAKVCGKHSAIYEAYYKQIDPKGTGTIEAMTAAKFLKKSGLSDVVLSRVWDLSDPNGKGFLDKPGFYVALKLVSLAQAGQVYNMNNIYMETANPPKVGDLPKVMPPRIQTVPVSSGGVATGDWSISVIDRLKYEQLFESLKPVGGLLAGNKVKGVLMESKLPMDTLGKIWDLADQDKDGNLDKHEFIVAMHLVYQTLDKRTVPDVLPAELRKPLTSGGPPPKPAPPTVAATVPRAPSGEGFADGGFVANFPKDIAPPPAIPPLPITVPPMTRVPPVGSAATTQPLIPTDPLIPIGAPPSVTANADWVVTANDLKRFEVIFRDSDRDKDGLVSGLEVKNVFLQSGVPQKLLAHIWALCDTNQSGKLTLEQFALAMWMVERKQKGIEPPQVLTANMVPPSMRGIISGVDLQPQVEAKPAYSNPELEMISKEIEELAKERRALETEIAQKEADIRVKSGEVRSLQSELDTLSATLKQLENQRGEAQKRLDDLKAQVNKIREQCQKQEETINEQEGELNAKRAELQKLKDEETSLQKEYDENNRELQKLTNHLQNTQLQISSVRSMVTQLMETQRQMTDALLMCRAAIDAENCELVSEYQLKIEPDFDDARKTLEKEIEDPKSADPFGDNKAKTNTSNGFSTNGFGHDPFAATANDNKNAGTARGGFDDSFNTTSGFDSGFDAFGGSSAFGQTQKEQQQKDPFGGDAFANKTSAVTPEPGKDDFGSDPFAALHAPTGQGQVLSASTQPSKTGPPPRPESPSPALPPKKSKVPPPRPAPPRPLQAPTRPTQPAVDAFGTAMPSSGGGFADFADFDNKLSALPPPLPTPLTKSVASTTTSQNLLNNKNAPSSKSALVSGVTTTTTITTNTTSPPTLSSSLSTFPATSLASKSTAPVRTSLKGLQSTTTTTSATITSTSTATTTTATTTTATITSTSTSTSTTTATITTTSTTNAIAPINNQSKYSSTPLQLNAGLFDSVASGAHSAAATSSDSSDSVLGRKQIGPLISGPTDFSDDPFKDYRYEDPFSIKDPFDDDDNNVIPDPEKIFKDDISSEDDEPQEQSSQGKGSLAKASAFGVTTTPATSSNEFLDKFDAFNLNSSPSPVPSQHSITSNTFVSKSKSNTPVSGVGGGAGLFDNFANFDAFSTKSSSTVDSASNKSTTTTNNNNNNNNNSNRQHDPFFDTFNDKFDSNSGRNVNSNNNITKNSNIPKIGDAFGDVKTKDIHQAFDAFAVNSHNNVGQTANALFDAFNDKFEDDFFRNTNTATTKSSAIDNLDLNFNKNTKREKMTNDFAKFDEFGDDFGTASPTTLNNSYKSSQSKNNRIGGGGGSSRSSKTENLIKVQNQTTLSKTPNTEVHVAENGTKLAEKFAADYSKPETFEDDLQEALKRSMVEK